MTDKYFLHQIKHNKTNDTFDKGIVIKDTFEAAKQSYHAYLGAYAYGQNPDTDFVSCETTNINGVAMFGETWAAPEPEEPEEEPVGSGE